MVVVSRLSSTNCTELKEVQWKSLLQYEAVDLQSARRVKILHVEGLGMQFYAGDWCLTDIVARLGWSPKVSNTIRRRCVFESLRASHAQGGLKMSFFSERPKPIIRHLPWSAGNVCATRR